jgi:aerobic C4-dicarboxylate transport protein
VTGAGLATLAGGLQSHRPDLVDGVGLIVGIDRFMSEARALTNFAGNAVATMLVGTWTDEIDKERVARVFDGREPFDEEAFQRGMDSHGGHGHAEHPAEARAEAASPADGVPATVTSGSSRTA